MFSAKLIAALLGFGLSSTFRIDLGAKGIDFGFKPLQRLGDRLKFHRDLSTLCAERFEIALDRFHLSAKTLCVAIKSGEGFFSLRHLIARLTNLLQQLHRLASRRFGALLC